MTPTIREVARKAGVSVATVSRVLNSSTPVSPSTRHRVEAAVRMLRYVPHSGARSLITRRTYTLGVLLPDLYGEFFSELIRGLDTAARARGYHLLLSGSHSDPAQFSSAVAAMRGRVDGLVVMSPDMPASALRQALPETVPCTLVGSAPRSARFDCLGIDNAGGAAAMVTHLLSHGHRRIAIINGPRSNSDARARLRGYRTALREAGVQPTAELELPGNFTEDSGYDAGRAIMSLREPPTAVFAANDSMAIGAMSALREAGRRIPEDVAVGGFDDIPIAHYLTPPLSSVHVAIAELGARAIASVTEVAENNGGAKVAAPRRATVATTLVIRNTCGVHEQPRRPDAHRVRRRVSFSRSPEAGL